MIAVAIVGVLAGLAVMTFSKSTRKARGSEALAMFTALRVAEEQYHLENGTYYSTGATEADTWPAAPTKTSQTLLPLPAEWTTLKVRLPEETAYCGYVAIAGAAGDGTGIGAQATAMGMPAAPTTDWYYLLAHCDLDGQNARDSYYFTWSGDTRIQKLNEGY